MDASRFLPFALRTRSVIIFTLTALVASACGAQTVSTASPDDSATTVVAASDDTSTTEAAPLVPLSAAVQRSMESSPLWIAESLGLFAQHGIDIDFVPVEDAEEVVSAILSQSAHVGVVSSTSMLTSPENRTSSDLHVAVYVDGTDVSIPEGRGTLSLVGPTGSSISSGCDLEGASVGVSSVTSAAAVAVREMARSAGCDSRLIGFVRLTQQEIIDSLASGDIDAAATLDPLTAQILRESNELIANLDLDLCRLSGPCPLSVAVFEVEWAAANPDVVDAFREAVHEATIWIRSNELEYRAELIKCCALTVEDAAELDVPTFVGDSTYLATDMARLQAIVDEQRALPELAEETGETADAGEAADESDDQ